MFGFFRRQPQRQYSVLARRYLVPPNKQPTFRQFVIEAPSLYEASRKFDVIHRLDRLDTTEA